MKGALKILIARECRFAINRGYLNRKGSRTSPQSEFSRDAMIDGCWPEEVSGHKCRLAYRQPNYALMTPVSRTLVKGSPPFDMPPATLSPSPGQLVERKSIISVKLDGAFSFIIEIKSRIKLETRRNTPRIKILFQEKAFSLVLNRLMEAF